MTEQYTASTLLFGRYAKIKIGIPGKLGKRLESISKDTAGEIVQGIRMSFKIEKTSEVTPNKAQIDLYNVNQDTINLLHTKGAVIILEVGYGILGGANPVSKVIFMGDVFKCVTLKKGTDYVTTIENGDGLNALQTSNVNASFAPGTPVKSVIEQVMGNFGGLGVGEVNLGDAASSQFVNGFTASGSARDTMDQLAGKTNTEWSVQDGQVQMLPINSFTSLPPVLLQSVAEKEGGASINTGLIGSPTLSGFSHSKEKNLHGVEFKALLNPELTPGRRVHIISKNKKVFGTFVVRKVTHNGDTRTGPWFSECEGAAP